MRLPRDLSGAQLAQALQRYGYTQTRQTGSHIRLTLAGEPAQHLTVPAHKSLRVGTLNAILADVARHLGRSKDEVCGDLFG